MRSGTSFKDRNLFLGLCDQCHELYEAESVVDDLEGVTFNCKKDLCEGRVTLQIASDEKAPQQKASFSQVPSKGPRRYC